MPPRSTKKKPRAGLIPFYVDQGQILMMFMVPSDPKFGGSDPQIAKGEIDPGETVNVAAMREAGEELGLKPSNTVGPLIGPVTANLKFPKETYDIAVFAVQVRNINNFNKPHFETGKTFWLTVKQFNTIGRQAHLPLVRALHTKIKNALKSTTYNI